MSNDLFVQSGQGAAPPNEAEYNAVYAAVTATERGRWFLAEFANRNRKADTDLILGAIARIDEAVRAGTAPQAAVAREAALAAAPAVIAQLPPTGGERDEDDVVAGVIASVASAEPRQDVQSVARQEARQEARARQEAQPDMPAMAQAQKNADDDYSEAVAAIAASLTSRLEERANDPVEEAAEPAREAEPPPQRRASQGVSQDNSPRWHIESPDFVFGAADLDAGIIIAEPQRETPQLQSQRLGAEIMSQPNVPLAATSQETHQDLRQDTCDEPQSRLTAVEAAVVDTIVEAAIETPTPAEPALRRPFRRQHWTSYRLVKFRVRNCGSRARRYRSISGRRASARLP